MSALGHWQTFAVNQPMSALPLKADMRDAKTEVRFGPLPDMELLPDVLIGSLSE
jgi:hypothetical protein